MWFHVFLQSIFSRITWFPLPIIAIIKTWQTAVGYNWSISRFFSSNFWQVFDTRPKWAKQLVRSLAALIRLSNCGVSWYNFLVQFSVLSSVHEKFNCSAQFLTSVQWVGLLCRLKLVANLVCNCKSNTKSLDIICIFLLR